MKRYFARGLLLLATAFAFGTHTATADNTPATTAPAGGGASATAEKSAAAMPVYDTALAPGWENWSWAKTELSLELTGSVRKPIKVEAGGWQALYLHHAPFSTTGLRKIGFLIQGTAPDREVRLFMLIDGKPVGEGKVVKFSNTGWTQVEVPLVILGVEDKTVDGIWLQNTSAEELPKFYVTEIRLE